MKTSFIQDKDDIEIIINFILMLNGLLITTFYFYSKITYKKIADICEKEIGPSPVTTIVCKNAGLFTTPGLYLIRVAFVMETSIFRYNKISNYGMSIEGYNLIKGLPYKLTLGLKIEIVLWIPCIPVLLSMFTAF